MPPLRPLRPRLAALLGVALGISAPVAQPAERVATSGEGALAIAAQLIERGHYKEAEQILGTLASGDPAAFDMRAVDRLSARSAFRQGDLPYAEKLLTSLAAYDPADWHARYDLAKIQMAAGEPRAAHRTLVGMLRDDPPADFAARARADLAAIAERQVVRVSFAAAAAPSTNINAATSARTFDLFGFLPATLDDAARAQSGIGLTWQVGGVVAPALGGNARLHLALRSQFADYQQANFDQASGLVELGVRFGGPSARTRALWAGTHEIRQFAGDPYAAASGARVTIERDMTPRLRLGAELKAEDVRYTAQSTRDGWVYALGVQMLTVPRPGLQLALSVTGAREAAAERTLANSQYGLGGGIFFTRRGLQFGVMPAVTFRHFDAAAAIYGARREDVTAEAGLRLEPRRALRGFRPSVTYRYTDNQSTVSLFDYERHTVEFGVARAF